MTSAHYTVEIGTGSANGVHLRVTGDLDLASSGMLLETITGVAPPPMHEVVVDLAAVGFMDSSGLAALVQAHARLLDQQVRLVLVHPSTQVRQLLQVTGADHHLNVEGAD